jgi:hypothetical protein
MFTLVGHLRNRAKLGTPDFTGPADAGARYVDAVLQCEQGKPLRRTENDRALQSPPELW